jgi:hypothetical protein
MESVQDAPNEETIALILGEFQIEHRDKRKEGCALLQRSDPHSPRPGAARRGGGAGDGTAAGVRPAGS